MNIKNLLLLLVLLNGFAARPTFAAGAPAAQAADDVEEGEGAEECKGPDAEDVAPASAGTDLGGGAEGVVGGAEEPAFGRASQGALARIELLRGSLISVPPSMRGASLLHGAMLWEMGIVKMLYALLVTPMVEVENGQSSLVPNEELTLFPLAKILIELFRLTGASFQPTMNRSCVAYNLQIDDIARLYKAVISKEVHEWSLLMPKTIRNSGAQNKNLFKLSQERLKLALILCQTNNGLNPKNLLPSIIMAFFWAKFVMGVSMESGLTFQQAQNNYQELMTILASGGGAGAAVSPARSFHDKILPGQSLDSVEAEIIARIKVLYQYNIPKPPFQNRATINSLDGSSKRRTFPDCGECGMRGLFCAAFYDIKNQQFIVPNQDGYSDKVKEFFKTYVTVDQQSSQDARNAWAAVCSDQEGIMYDTYKKNDDRCDLNCRFENLMSLLGLLVPAAIPTDCNCLAAAGDQPASAATMAGAGAGASAVVKTPVQPMHSVECAVNILRNFCHMPGHDLVIKNLVVGDNTTWEVTSNKKGDGNCHLFFSARVRHIDCELRGVSKSDFGQILDPILGGSDAISIVPKEPDLIEPLVFAAARMAQQYCCIDGACVMSARCSLNQRAILEKNIHAWDLRRPQDDEYFDNPRGSLTIVEILKQSCKYGYFNALHTIVSGDFWAGDKDNFFSYKLLGLAIDYGQLAIAEFFLYKGLCPFIQSAGDIGHKKTTFWSAFSRAVNAGYLDLVKLMLAKEGIECSINNWKDREEAYSSFCNAASDGHFQMIVYCLDNKLVSANASDVNGMSALMLAAQSKSPLSLSIASALVKCGAIINTQNSSYKMTALMYAAQSGNINVLKFLLSEDADVNVKDWEGLSALFFAASSNSTDALKMVEALAEAGALLNETDDRGRTVLSYAQQAGNKAVIDYLQDHDA